MSIYVKTSTSVSSVLESMIQFVENNYDYQVYDIGHKLIRVVSGSVVIDGIGTDYVLFASQDKLRKMFDTTQVDVTRLSVTTCNGDSVSNAVKFYAIQNWKGDLYQYFHTAMSGQIRINYRLVYVYPSK